MRYSCGPSSGSLTARSVEDPYGLQAHLVKQVQPHWPTRCCLKRLAHCQAETAESGNPPCIPVKIEQVHIACYPVVQHWPRDDVAIGAAYTSDFSSLADVHSQTGLWQTVVTRVSRGPAPMSA